MSVAHYVKCKLANWKSHDETQSVNTAHHNSENINIKYITAFHKLAKSPIIFLLNSRRSAISDQHAKTEDGVASDFFVVIGYHRHDNRIKRSKKMRRRVADCL